LIVLENGTYPTKQRPISLIVLGAGNRGTVYSQYAVENPQLAQVVGIVEPSAYRMRQFLKKHPHIPPSGQFKDWKEMIDKEKFADAVVIATPDHLHAEAALAFANKKYNLLVEKPMAITQEDCVRIAQAAKKNNVLFCVCHVLRYTPYTQKIKEIINSGIIGEVMNIQHLEPVGQWHFAHSYVRGNWRKESEATFSLLAKSCHDIDWIHYIMGAPCLNISSFGSLAHFKKSSKPKAAGTATRCLDCPIKTTCPYSATRIYLEMIQRGDTSWPIDVLTTSAEPDIESVTDELQTGPYGRCVYECDNDVCDNQVVNMEFEGGKTASFSMVAFTRELSVRKTRIHGTLGQLECDGLKIVQTVFNGCEETPAMETFEPRQVQDTKMHGHNYADWYLMDSFVSAIATGDKSKILSGTDETLESHLLVFGAEQARKQKTVVNVANITHMSIDSNKEREELKNAVNPCIGCGHGTTRKCCTTNQTQSGCEAAPLGVVTHNEHPH